MSVGVMCGHTSARFQRGTLALGRPVFKCCSCCRLHGGTSGVRRSDRSVVAASSEQSQLVLTAHSAEFRSHQPCSPSMHAPANKQNCTTLSFHIDSVSGRIIVHKTVHKALPIHVTWSGSMSPIQKHDDASSESSQDSGDRNAPEGSQLQMSREVIALVKDYIFSFDTFFVTQTENYRANGVLFRGNLRGDPGVAFDKMERRCKEKLGEEFQLYLLTSQEDTPVVVLLPSGATEPPASPIALPLAAVVTVSLTLFTTLNATGMPLLGAVASGDPASAFAPEYVLRALPGTLGLFGVLGAHEAGHWWAARREGVTLRYPLVVPAGLGIIGSFGAITGIRSVVRDRRTLLRVASAGPAAGYAASAVALAAGMLMTLAQKGPLEQVQSSAFNDSFIMGVIGQITLGQQLTSSDTILLSPVLLAGWAGLIINALNSIALGELDGGRIAHAMWGRQPAARIGVFATLGLGLASIVGDDLALYWIVFTLIAQRGPIVPQSNEVSEPVDPLFSTLAVFLLASPFLVLLPFPSNVTQLADF